MKSDIRLSLLIIAVALLSWTGAVAKESIDDIQAYDPATGSPDSPFLGQTVTVSGVVTSPLGTVAPDVLYLQDDTGGIMIHFPGEHAPEAGDFIAVTGVVDHHLGSSSEVRVVTSAWGPLGFSVLPAQAVLSPTQAASDPEYIGTLARVGGWVSSVDGSGFGLTDGVDTLRVEITPATGISLTDVAVADSFTVVGPLGRDGGGVRILPREQYDLAEGDSYNDVRLASISCDNWAPEVGESWTMSFVVEATDPPDQIVFRYRYVEAGPEWTTLTWSPPKGMKGVYPVEFVGASYSTPSEVEWDCGESNINLTTMTPIRSFYYGTVPIEEIQRVDPCDPDLSSPWEGRAVNVHAFTVTDETGRAVLMDVSSAAKGVYPTEFVGASYGTPSEVEWDFDDGNTNSTTMTPFFRGDEARFGAKVYEIDGLTVLSPITYNSETLLSFTNDLPEGNGIPTGVLGDNVQDGDCVQGEAFESVRVRPLDPVVVDASSFAVDGTYRIATAGVLTDAITVRHSKPLNYVPSEGDLLDVAGYMDSNGGEYQMVVGSDADVAVVGVRYGSLVYTPTGDADIVVVDGPPDTLLVTGMGSSEDDGVSIDLTDVIPEETMFGVALEFDAVVGNWLEGRAYGLVDGSEELLMTSTTTVDSDSVHVARLDFSTAQSSPICAVIMLDGEPVRWIYGLPPVLDLRTVGTFASAAPELVYDWRKDEDGSVWVSYKNGGGDTYWRKEGCNVAGDVLFTVGPGNYSIDFALMNPLDPFDGYTKVDIGGNVSGFAVVDEIAEPAPPFDVTFDGFNHIPTGRTSLSPVDDVLAWEQVGDPALGGFQVDLEGKVLADSVFTSELAIDAAVGQAMTVTPTATALGVNMTPCSLMLDVATDSTQTWTVDLSTLGCQAVTATVSSGGVVTGEEAGLPSTLLLEVLNPSLDPLDVAFGIALNADGLPSLRVESDMVEAKVKTTGGAELFILGAGRQTVNFQAMDTFFPVDALLFLTVVCSPDLHGLSIVNEEMIPVPVATSVEPPDETVPSVASILSVHPNPFNPATEIAFGLPSRQHVSLVVHDLLGREVRRIFNGELPAGMHEIVWNGRDDFGAPVSSGTYLLRIHTDDKDMTRKLMLLK